jgi:hypothetical protein
MTSPKDFRRQLDDVLSQRDPEALRAFLLASGQWQEDNTPKDLAAAMWMMIAGSPALVRLHDEADAWLRSHGHEAEAQAILGRRGGAGTPPSGSRPSGGRPGGSGPRSARPQGQRQGPGPRHGGQHPHNGRRPAPGTSSPRKPPGNQPPR